MAFPTTDMGVEAIAHGFGTVGVNENFALQKRKRTFNFGFKDQVLAGIGAQDTRNRAGDT